MPQTLLQKLRIKPGCRIAVINMPVPRPELRDPFPSDVTLVGDLEGPIHQVHLFVASKAELDRLAPAAMDALVVDGLLWVFYPKGTSGIQTDLTRDKGWDVFKGTTMQFVNLISLDATWSAFGLKKGGGVARPIVRKRPEPATVGATKFIDKEKRIVKAPPDLLNALSKNKKAGALFNGLSFTHKKECVEWIIQAKREETRKRRVEGVVKRLIGGEKAKGKRK